MDRRMRRKVALGAAFAAMLAVPLAVAWPSFAAQTSPRAPRTMSVNSMAALSTAVADAVPGDTIRLAAGTYTSGTIKANKAGTAAAPITISAQSVGATELAGTARIDLSNSSHVVVSGFVITSTADFSVPTSAAAARITRNTFNSNKSGAYLTVGADNTEVDHNTFENKTTAGVFLQVTGPGAHGMAKNVHVDHNYFFNHQFKGSNGGESIRFGLSGKQHADAAGLIEDNLFEKADGDSEAISVKSSNNVVRNNTLRNSRGTISLRHGWGTTVEGNFVIGSSSGIRFFGNNHVIINNVVEDTTGQPLEVGGGELRDDTNSGTDHEAADNCLVAFNTFVGNSGRVVKFGSDKKFAPSNDTLADNIFQAKSGSAATGGGSGLKFQGNIINGVSAGSLPAGGFKSVNPQLTRDANGVFRLVSGSPAINAAVGSFPQVVTDIDGTTRTAPFDVGADEFSAGGPIAKPLTTADVGPNAP